MARVLAIGRGRRSTGYGRVIQSILREVRDEHDVANYAIDGRGEADDGDVPAFAAPNPTAPFQGDGLADVLARLRPAVVFLCHDPWIYKGVAPVLDAAPSRPAVVCYCPVGFSRAERSDLAALASVDRLVAYTEFGRDVLGRALGARDAAREIAVVPHGVDTGTFRPLDRREARSLLFPERPELRDAFIVLNANRNAPRKRLDLTLEVFAEFARGKPDAYLYLHCGMLDIGVDVPGKAAALGVADRLLVTSTSPRPPEVSDERLNAIYAACDVGLNTCVGEGWGLVAFEHAATGAAQLVPAHSACHELWREAGVLLPAVPQLDAVGAGEVSREAAAAALDSLYRDRARLAERSRAALSHATAPRFDWRRIGESWKAIFAEAATHQPKEQNRHDIDIDRAT